MFELGAINNQAAAGARAASQLQLHTASDRLSARRLSINCKLSFILEDKINLERSLIRGCPNKTRFRVVSFRFRVLVCEFWLLVFLYIYVLLVWYGYDNME